ncbi:hypothetical protein TRIUR3_12223 [Triticum urartu]|uniref:Uncharacterized protein n=1 Tax=Triticum urartu TaxID=4572 RepID=M8A0H1_TRIUA|nr:hypothetical protein TRIUR3_12223 [Triticum urartu]
MSQAEFGRPKSAQGQGAAHQALWAGRWRREAGRALGLGEARRPTRGSGPIGRRARSTGIERVQARAKLVVAVTVLACGRSDLKKAAPMAGNGREQGSPARIWFVADWGGGRTPGRVRGGRGSPWRRDGADGGRPDLAVPRSGGEACRGGEGARWASKDRSDFEGMAILPEIPQGRKTSP